MDASYGRRAIAACVLALGLVLGFGTEAASAETFMVDYEEDEVDADLGDRACRTKAQRCTLRAAIMQANVLEGHDVVKLRAVDYRLTIPGSDEDAAATGDLDVTDNLTIEGAGYERPDARAVARTLVDGNRLDRVFDVAEGRALVLLDMLVQGGEETDGLGGGGIRSRGVLSLTRVRLFDNKTPTSGGGILNDRQGVLALQSVVIDGNHAGGNGGGLALRESGRARLENVAISGNAAGGQGGGIANVEGTTLTLNGVTLSQNTAQERGGGLLAAQSSVEATNVTFSGNSANQGGGLANRNGGNVRLLNVTFFGNRAEAGGAIHSEATAVRIKNSIVARSYGDTNCAGPITSEGSNIDSRESCGFTAPGDRMTTDPHVRDLWDNGGFARTHAPVRGSPAIDSADNGACPSVDQRGVARPIDGDGNGSRVCDRGAVEADPRAQ